MGCWTNGLVDQWLVGPMGDWTNGLADQWVGGRMDRWTNGLLNQWMAVQWVVGPMGCCTNGCADWTNGPVDQWTNGLMDQPRIGPPTWHHLRMSPDSFTLMTTVAKCLCPLASNPIGHSDEMNSGLCHQLLSPFYQNVSSIYYENLPLQFSLVRPHCMLKAVRSSVQ